MDLKEPRKANAYVGLSPSARVLSILGKYATYGVVPKVVPPPDETGSRRTPQRPHAA